MKHRLIVVCILFVAIVVVCLGTVFLRTKITEHAGNQNQLKSNEALPSLDESIQQYIWDTEHVTFEIEQRLFPKIMTALREFDRSRLGDFLTEEFSGTIPTQPSRLIEHNQIQQRSRPEAELSEKDMNAEQFSEYLSHQLEELGTIQHLRLRVIQISADDRDPSSGRWKLRLLLVVAGTSIEGRSFSFEQTSSTECRFKDDKEISDGRIFATWRILSESLTSSPVLMTEVTGQVGLDRFSLHDNWNSDSGQPRQYYAQIACDDWTLDGRPDIAIATLTGQALLLVSTEDGQFVDATRAFGVPNSFSIEDRQSLSALFDFDNDGDPDLLLGSQLYRNVEGKHFEVVENTRLNLNFDPRSCVIADYDCDGLLDLYILYQHSRGRRVSGKKIGWLDDDVSGAVNQLWRNLGDGRYTVFPAFSLWLCDSWMLW